MKRYINNILLIILVVTSISGVLILIHKNANKEEAKEGKMENNNELKQIYEIKKELGINGKDTIYMIDQEYDGRKVLKIKPEVQYSIVLAGIIKQTRPEYNEVQDICSKIINKKGIWISEGARQQFLEILKKVGKANYRINKEGYLEQEKTELMNEYDKKIKKINRKKQIYIDINSICYVADEVTGKITEYPFEEMDPYIPYEHYELNDKIVYVITKNNKGKIKLEEVLKDILDNIKI